MIPKIIHYCWFGGNPLPESALKCIESWKKYCPDYEIKEWNESNFDVSANRYTHEAYQKKKYAFVTDYVRLYVLNNYGGIYMDTDVEVTKSLDDFLKYSAFSGFEQGNKIPTGIIGAEAGNKWIGLLIDDYDNRAFIRTNGEMDLTTNVALITKKTVANYSIKLNNTEQHLDDVSLFPFDYFCAKNFTDGKIVTTQNTYTIHHFAGSWHDDEQNYASKLKQKYIKIFPRKIAVILATAISKVKYEGLQSCIKWIFKINKG